MRVFVGHDSHQPQCSKVLAHSLVEHASIPLDVNFLVLSELDFDRPRDPLQSTDSTYIRFLVPHLCAYQGVAAYMDADMLCLADVAELARLDMAGLALRVVKHDHRPVERLKMDGIAQTTYPRKNWSSLMIMNCERLTLWTKEVVERKSGAFLHRFQGIPDELIGDIPRGWNDLDRRREGTKLLHYTSGGPWLEEHRSHPDGGIWKQYRNACMAATQTALRREGPSGPCKT